MQILKRSKGIDLTSKNSSLLGQAEISLIDIKSGKVSEKIKQKNTFTQALDSLFNAVPYNLNDGQIYNGVVGYANNLYRQSTLVEKAIGGILLFPDVLSNDLTEFYPTFDGNYPTGYASRAEYTQEDSRQGTFDAVNSGEVTNGYKFSYNWGSSYGNGRVASVALSNVNCYKYFNDFATAFAKGVPSEQSGITSTGSIVLGKAILQYSYIVGANKRGVYIYTPSTATVSYYPLQRTMISLIGNYPDVLNDSNMVDIDFAVPSNSQFFLTDDELHVFTIGTGTITHTTIDLDDDTSTSTSFSFSESIATNNIIDCVIRNNYLYIAKSGGGFFKINLSNTADFDEIASPSVTNYSGIFLVNNKIFGYNYVIGEDDVVRMATSYNSKGAISGHGVWIIRSLYPVSTGIATGVFTGIEADVLTPYCATKANLETAVTKTADKQMIVNYTVTQV